MRRIDQLAQALVTGETTSRKLIEEALVRIADPGGEGGRAFIKVYADQSRTLADAADALRRAGRSPGRYASIPIALKDLSTSPVSPLRPARRCWPTLRPPPPNRATASYNCLAMPTVPIVAPRTADLDDERAYNNMLILRNTAPGNFFDRCVISLPCHSEGQPPAGLMLMGETMGDARLFSIAAAVEAALGR